MEHTQLLKEQSGAENTENKLNSNSENTELEATNNKPIGRTPLIGREQNGKWFATVGNYKVSENYNSYESLVKWAEKNPTWEHVAAVVGAQFDYFQSVIDGLNNRIEKLENQ